MGCRLTALGGERVVDFDGAGRAMAAARGRRDPETVIGFEDPDSFSRGRAADVVASKRAQQEGGRRGRGTFEVELAAGVGLGLTKQLLVTSVMPGSAAERAGVAVGGRITHIDGRAIGAFHEAGQLLGQAKQVSSPARWDPWRPVPAQAPLAWPRSQRCLSRCHKL